MFTVLLHEATHALGFFSSMQSNGLSKKTNSNPGVYSLFDRYILTNTNANVVNNSTFTYSGTALNTNLLRYFEPTNTKWYSIYSPTFWEAGSSLSHFDGNRDKEKYLMTPAYSGGLIRTWTKGDLEVLCDLGYTLTAADFSCTDRYAIGVNDNATTTSLTSPITVNVITNDYDLDAGQTVALDASSITLLTNGGILSTAGNSITFTPNGSYCGDVIIRYRPKTVQNSITGSYATLTISIPCPNFCPNDPCNLICNGSFEDAITVNMFDAICNSGSSGEVIARGGAPGWSTSTPYNNYTYMRGSTYSEGGISSIGGPLSSNGITRNTYTDNFGGLDTRIPSQNRYSAVWTNKWDPLQPGMGWYSGGLYTKLASPLVVGQQYNLRFYTYTLCQAQPFGGTCIPPTISTTFSNSLPVWPAGVNTVFHGDNLNVMSCNYNSANVWTPVNITFTASNTSNYFVVQGENIVTSGLSNGDIPFIFVDDFRLEKVGNQISTSVTSSTSNPLINQNVTFTIQVCNRGTTTVSNVSIQNMLPTGFTLVSSTLSAYPNHTFASLAAGACQSLTVIAQAPSTVQFNTDLQDCATVTSANACNQTQSCSTVKVLASDISVSTAQQSCNKFRVTISNIGTVSATNVVASYSPPTCFGYTGYSVISGSATYASNQINIPSLPAGASVVVEFTGGASIAANCVNTVTFLSASNLWDNNINNNSASITMGGFGAGAAGTNQNSSCGQAVQIGTPLQYGFTYSWSSNPTGFTSTLPQPTVAPTQNTIYTLTMTSGGCSYISSVSVNTNYNVLINSSGGTCLGTALLTATPTPTGTYTYQWKLNSTNILGATAATYTPNQSGSYTVVITNGTGCTATSPALNVNPLPTAAISTVPVYVCSGTSTTLTASGGTTYTWSTTATTAAITVAPTLSTTYTVTVKDGNNCSATASRIVNIPTLAINPNPAQFCPGGSIVLSATCSQPINTYAWLLNPANNTPTFTRTTFGTVNLRVTAGTNPVCTLTNSISVTAKAYPSVGLPPSVSANCATGTMTLGGTPTAQGGSGTYAYVWSPATGLSSTTIANPTRTGTAGLPLTYTVTVTDAASGCTANATQVAQNSVYGFLEVLDGPAASAGRVVSDLAVDNSGDVYATGWFEGDVNFQNDGYVSNQYYQFTNAGYKGLYVGKYSGCNVPSYQWKYVSTLNDVACAEVAPPFVGEGSCSQPYTPHIALTATGKIYMGGTQNAVNTRAVISRLTTAGVTDYESFQQNIAITDVESDGSNNVYITGFATTSTATLGGVTFNSGELFIAQINTASSTLAFNWVYRPVNGTVNLLSSDGLPALATATSGATNYLILSTGKYLQAYTATATAPTPLGAILSTGLSPSKGNRIAFSFANTKVFLLNNSSIYSYRFSTSVGMQLLTGVQSVSTNNLAYDLKVNGTDLFVINYSNTLRYLFSSAAAAPMLSSVWTSGTATFSPCYTGQTLYTTANGFDRCIAIDPNVATNNRIYIGGGHLNCALKTMSTVYSVHKTDGIPYGWVNRINNATGVFFKTEEEETSSEPNPLTPEGGIGVSLYPNPVNGELHFVRHGGGNQITEIVITDLLGRVVKKLQQLTDAETLYQIDMSDVANDTYLVRIKTEQEQIVKKIIKTAN